MTEERYYEMLWDCAQCGIKGLLGKSQRHCPACGAAQDPAKRYFPEAGQEVEAVGHQYVGADWTCAYCASPNAAMAAHCTNCGGPKEGTKNVALVSEEPVPPAPSSSPPSVASPGKPGFPWGRVVVGIVLLLAASLGYLFFSKHDETATISSLRWSRSVDIERFVAVSDAAWCDSMPSGAYSVTHSREQRGTRKVEDGQECTDKRVDMGDGTFRKQHDCHPRYRSESVYDDKCHFRINRWQVVHTEKAEGGPGQAPVWPAMAMTGATGYSGTGVLGRERPGARHERYIAELQSGHRKTWSCELPSATWSALREGQTVTLKVRGTGGAVCDSLH